LAKAGDETEPDRVLADGEGFSRERHRDASTCGKHRDPSANQVGCQHRQPIDLIIRPAVFDHNVLALAVACVFQALTKSA
jgi:hypothetical protein